ncbi:MAG: competence protein ComEA [Gaiellales bacterium]|jgi:competence protein ComEA|nr:competence protein ComEA [Gaiellales bacterium]
MLPLPPHRLALYAAIAVVVLVIGWRAHGSTPQAAYDAPAVSTHAPADPALQVVVVDVTGAVKRPGVYRFTSGARVLDAVRKARAGRNAQLEGLNLAERLADGEQIVVPRRGEAPPPGAAAGTGSTPAIVHLNSATLEQLETLDGVGPSLAQRIIDFRTLHGGFRSLDELDQVSGFGPARMAALHGHVAL